MPVATSVTAHSRFTDYDINLFRAGKNFRLYDKLGSHVIEVAGERGTYFAVWAPSARAVHVFGDFNSWDKQAHPLNARWDSSGIYEGFIPGVENGAVYKYAVQAQNGDWLEKGDPFARLWEVPPKTASVVWDTYYEWNDTDWMKDRYQHNGIDRPYSVYEVHLGSWKKTEKNESLNYRDLATELVDYLTRMNYTHVEFLPVMEHPYFPSWGYQITGYFAPSSRFGGPQDFMALVDALHAAGIGVILDWVPSHFPNDAHGLAQFDGTHLYDHADPRKGFHPDWKSAIFNYGRNEVRSFLISNALFWLDRYHIDGLRVDAVASMLYLDYSRKAGEWIPNEYGGNENLEAISFLREFNEAVYKDYPDTMTIAEESTAFSGVSRPTYVGGLGFGQKWMMGWMHDTLKYFKEDPINRSFHHNTLTFSLAYAFSENFMLPLSHDEVVHGKGPLIDRMPGDEWQRFANLRLLYGYMMTHPGSKLNFMGGEFGQTTEWSIERGLDWSLTDYRPHATLQQFVADLNKMYRETTALYAQAYDPRGFEWIDIGDHQNSVLSYLRRGKNDRDIVAVVHNFTPTVRADYRLGVPFAGTYTPVINSDDEQYGGTGNYTQTSLQSVPSEWNGRPNHVELTLPPLATVVLRFEASSSVDAVTTAKKKQPAAKKAAKSKTTAKKK
ncbi:1,4-alpha-glucan branching enzyme GlgB [Neolewinella maritima]|uniref:1,4-alpha-glucan branching enzyme GlgB n=1 Tax=Neolewinella maritima TaxID=1383882 RepID=A0ABM9AYA1_9BACT|nr:1,4-alpha-glucan branching protein GlgB [Neolewinella maritima]CAH0999628.1 1,4-alpha-glucan branching enzyme GlgB [Neolewinella maritima]